ncbi:MAG TPA: hypothetical protein VKT54_13885 [Steroidobacteraceae bacterium]|nr:hypothetical protein [Steroidobacteraceae bacterium]
MSREATADDFGLEPPALLPHSDAYGLDACHPDTRAAFAVQRAEREERNEEQRQRDLAAQRIREARLAEELAR